MSDLPYPDHGDKTHFDGCWKRPHHHNCAVRRVECAEELLRKVCVAMSCLCWPEFDDEPVCDPSKHGAIKRVPGLREWWEANK